MIQTKLVLVEGPPGSGKSTTAQKLSCEIADTGIPCQCYLEWSEDHPIAIGEDLNLVHVVNTALERKEEMLEQWRQFALVRQTTGTVTVLESRFWQTGVMLMYAAGCSMDEVFESNRQVMETIRTLNPVLIHFVIDDIKLFAAATIQAKEQEWQQAGFAGSWAGHIYEALDHQPWFRTRKLSGLAGYCAFLEEWAKIADQLYERLPFPKIQVHNPYLDWNQTMSQLRSFLELV